MSGRKHCASKVHRLRQVTQTTSGKGKVYKKPPPITEASVKDSRWAPPEQTFGKLVLTEQTAAAAAVLC